MRNFIALIFVVALCLPAIAADTPRTEADLQVLFADNTSGAISPQDLRDFLVSVDMPFNVKHYGALGDGVTDDTVAIQAAMDAARDAGEGEVVFTDGIYIITATLIVDCCVRGVGKPTIRTIGDFPAVKLIRPYAYFKNMIITSDGSGGTSNDGIWVHNAARTNIQDTRVFDMGNDGVILDCSDGAGATIGNNNLTVMNNVSSRANGRDGLRIAGGYNNNGVLLSNFDAGANDSTGVSFYGFVNSTVLNNVVAQNNDLRGIYFEGDQARNNVGTVYLETNGPGEAGPDLLFDADAHSNFITLTNHGS